MKHYNDESWADFVRGVAPADLRQEMLAHLSGGCQPCQLSVNWMEQIQQVAKLDSEIPPELVRAVREIFPQAGVRNDWVGSLRPLVANLVFAASGGWQPAGVRTSSTAAVAPATANGGRMIFDAGDFRVHVKVEPPTVHEPGEIVGEIKNRTEPADSLEGVVVQSLASGRMISETTVNRFGEFLIDYPFLDDTVLRLAFKERGVRIDLVLDRQSSAVPGATKGRPQSDLIESPTD